MKRNFHLVLLFFVFRARAQDPPPAAHEQPGIDCVIEQVLANNPSLRSARANWRALKQRIPQARAWEDARVGVDVERMNRRNPYDYSDSEWMISQEFPLTGKNKLRGKVATSEAETAWLQLRRKELDLIAGARIAWFKLGNAHLQLDLNRKNQALWRQLTEITRRKYEVGAQSQADVLVAETEAAKIDEVLISGQRDIWAAESELNTLMGRAPAIPWQKPLLKEPNHGPLSFDELRTIALENRPELKIGRAKIDAARHRLELARKEWIPDPEFRIEARQVSGTGRVINEYDTGIFLKFPWFNRGKYSAMVREAAEMAEGAGHDLASLEQETVRAVHDQLKKVETFHHHYQLFKERLMPLAQQTVTSKRNVYETDKGSFLDLLTAQRTVQEVESMFWNHLTDYQIALAELEAIIGANLPETHTHAEKEGQGLAGCSMQETFAK